MTGGFGSGWSRAESLGVVPMVWREPPWLTTTQETGGATQEGDPTTQEVTRQRVLDLREAEPEIMRRSASGVPGQSEREGRR